MSLAAGDLIRRLRFEEAGVGKDPVSHETVRTWLPQSGTLLAEVLAAPLEETGRVMRTAQETWAEVEVGWRIRWHPVIARLTPTERFRVVDEDGRAFDLVTRPHEPTTGHPREELRIFAKGRAE